MIFAPGEIAIERDSHRSLPFISDILTFYAMSTSAMGNYYNVGSTPGATRMACPAVGVDLNISLANFLQGAATGMPFGRIVMTITPKAPEPEGHTAHGLVDLNTRVVAAIFCIFADAAREWIAANISTDFHKWPPVGNFARVVRNGIVHGGTINITSPTAATVGWHSVTYNHTSFGERVLGTGRLSAGDLILLMIDLDDELRQLGAPMPLA